MHLLSFLVIMTQRASFILQKFTQNYNESFVIPRSVTNATEYRLMEFCEKKYYVALIQQIKNQYLIK